MDELAEAFAEPAEVDDTPAPTAEPEKVESEEKPEKPEPEKQESEKPEKAESEKDSEPEKAKEPEYNDREKAYLAQAKDERQKRQEREKRIQELEEKLAATEKTERPDVFEDQEGYTESLRSEFQSELSKARIDMAEEMMRDRYEDYDEIREMVLEEMKSNTALKAELQSAANIPRALYDHGKKIRQFKEIKEFDPEAYKAKLRAELKAELAKEAESKSAEDDKPDLSPSLTDARGGNTEKVDLPENPEDLFG